MGFLSFIVFERRLIVVLTLVSGGLLYMVIIANSLPSYMARPVARSHGRLCKHII